MTLNAIGESEFVVQQTRLDKVPAWRACEPLRTASDAARETNLVGDIRHLVTGKPGEAARGVDYYMGVGPYLMPSPNDGVQAIIREIKANGTDEDKECLDYSTEGPAERLEFPNGIRDCDASGVALNERLNEEGARRREKA